MGDPAVGMGPARPTQLPFVLPGPWFLPGHSSFLAGLQPEQRNRGAWGRDQDQEACHL